jgi:hypothetical protein
MYFFILFVKLNQIVWRTFFPFCKTPHQKHNKGVDKVKKSAFINTKKLVYYCSSFKHCINKKAKKTKNCLF